jgi:hypothetical protein
MTRWQLRLLNRAGLLEICDDDTTEHGRQYGKQ